MEVPKTQRMIRGNFRYVTAWYPVQDKMASVALKNEITP
jgi:hypothetical protein